MDETWRAEHIFESMPYTFVDPMKKQLQLTKIQSKWDKNHIKEMQLINSIRRRSLFPYRALVQIDFT